MKQYFLRLDDTSDYMDVEKWKRMETLVDRYNIKPIFGIIPDNRDESLIKKYIHNPDFWELVHKWIDKGWVPAMHGCYHQYITNEGGINPINRRSEFAGVSFDKQQEMVNYGYKLLLDKNVNPNVFFAPSHTFDLNTLKALKAVTPIRIVSDTIAYDIYKDEDFWFIPQQCGAVRRLPFKIVTFCYHPNTMTEESFDKLDCFLSSNKKYFVPFSKSLLKDRNKNVFDKVLNSIYMYKHK